MWADLFDNGLNVSVVPIKEEPASWESLWLTGIFLCLGIALVMQVCGTRLNSKTKAERKGQQRAKEITSCIWTPEVKVQVKFKVLQLI